MNTERIFSAELVGWDLTDALKNVVRGAKKRQGRDETTLTATKPLRRLDEAGVKQKPAIRRSHSHSKRGVKMIETVTAVLVLFSAGIFVAHALEAFRTP